MALEPSPLDSRQAQAQGDTHTLSSIEMFGIGSLGAVRSFLDPSFRFGQAVDTGIIPGVKNSVTSLGMNLAFSRNGGRSTLAGSYSGAHVLYAPSSFCDTTYHNLAISQEVHWARWVLRLRDDMVISPETAFGGLDTGGTGAQIAQQSSAAVNDTILTQRAKRLNDTAAGVPLKSASWRSNWWWRSFVPVNNRTPPVPVPYFLMASTALASTSGCPINPR